MTGVRSAIYAKLLAMLKLDEHLADWAIADTRRHQGDPMTEPEVTGPMTCWWCGVEPEDIIEITQFDGTLVKQIPHWPPGDHPHAATPPSPDAMFDHVMIRPGGPDA